MLLSFFLRDYFRLFLLRVELNLLFYAPEDTVTTFFYWYKTDCIS
jgi:hypothetical protein